MSLHSPPSSPPVIEQLSAEGKKIRETSLTAIYSFTFSGAAANSENWGGRETAVGGDRKKMKWNQSLKAEEPVNSNKKAERKTDHPENVAFSEAAAL